MKPLHIVLLVIAGALGGAVITKVWQKSPAPVPAVAQVQTSAQIMPPAAPPETAEPALPAAHPETVEAPAAVPEQPARRERPMHHEAIQTERAHKVPPPAHPRPFRLAHTVPPPPPPGPGVQQTALAPASSPAQPITAIAPIAPPPAPPAGPPPEQANPAPALQPEPHKVTLNAGLLIPVRLVDSLSSERNAPGDTFTATLDKELVVDGFVIAERGARVEGRVVAAAPGTKVKGNATISIELTRLHTSDGQNVALQTDSFERRAEPNHQTDAAKVGGGAIIGAIIGGIAGGGKGAAIGAGAGGGVGAGDVLLTRKPATLPSETRVSFRLRAPVTLTEKRS